MAENNQFIKSDIGAQAAWKGFSSQTLYIASRIVADTDDNCFYPEDIEDLVIKNEDKVVEAVQIKNVSADLTVSHLSSTKYSLSGEGFFNRVCSLHAQYPEFNIVKVVYFNSLGDELNGISKGNNSYCKSVKEKLVNNHKLTANDAEWLVSSLFFEKVDISTLEQTIYSQVKEYVETMAAPEIAKSLLIQHVSELSKSKGFISKKTWKEQIHSIGVDIASIDGYFKEYNKSLVRLSELATEKSEEQLRNEFNQGISTHPDHIRYEIDFRREQWLNAIVTSMNETNIVIVKGVSGQGKTAICYRYLLENYPDGLVFCVRHISSEQQAENLIVALNGIAKHTQKLIVYIDVNHGETKWGLLVQEMSMRKINIPLLISIREEDFNLTPINGSMFAYKLIEVQLTEVEAKLIYDHSTAFMPHDKHRTFEESWISFGGKGPLIEFTYFLTNNQTLTERLRGQISNLLLEKVPDSWFDILKVVSLAGKIGGAVSASKLKNIVKCDNFISAIQRFTDEYLIRETLDKVYIEALHPIRATILGEVLKSLTIDEPIDDLLNCIGCIDAYNVQYLLMDYFTENPYNKQIIKDITPVVQNDWSSFARTVTAMLWLDVKRYYESNAQVISNLIEDKGKGWLGLMPIDVSGLLRPDEFVFENLVKDDSFPGIDKDAIIQTIDNLRASLSSLCVDFEAIDTFILSATIPTSNIKNDDDCDALGYSLFWLAKKNRALNEVKLNEDSWNILLRSDFQICANAVRGMFEHELLSGDYEKLKNSLLDRFLADYRTIIYSESENDVVCKFVPPVFADKSDALPSENFNHYWKIKALNILQQIFPTKEYIEVELLGVDILSDLAIKQMDYKVRIPKSNRNDTWITEINSWFISRVNYSCRPSSWNEYVEKIEKIRTTSNTLISDAISLVDNFYKKQRWSKDRWNKVYTGIATLSSLISKDLLLPVSVVDKYCLYREDMQNDIFKENNKIVIAPLLYTKYKKLKKELSNGYNSVENFFKNFADVLLKRINHTSLEGINLNLGLLNLFESLKSISKMQLEFDKFFQNYRSLEVGFNGVEVENLNVMLNVWHHVVEAPPKGYQIAYDAKQKYRKAIKLVKSLHSTEAIKDISIVSKENRMFFLKEFDANSSEMILECDFISETIHEYFFKNADQFSNEKWLIDTTGYEFVYIPLYNDIPINVGFSISSLRVFENRISDALFPAAIDKSIYEYLGIDYTIVEKCILLNATFGALKLLIHQYNEIAAFNTGDYCLHINGINNYAQSFADEMGRQVSNLAEQIDILNALSEVDEIAIEFIAAILECINRMNDLFDFVKKFEPIEEFETLVQNANGALAILQSYIVKENENSAR
ncbi:MAG: hypothetical protein APF81_25675 [Desulfosporosinus sp. BRH_c37]|nr:MAG: hypothetical protein APF81_25675 [Desulfosporosinus sp. BRH_c37]